MNSRLKKKFTNFSSSTMTGDFCVPESWMCFFVYFSIQIERKTKLQFSIHLPRCTKNIKFLYYFLIFWFVGLNSNVSLNYTPKQISSAKSSFTNLSKNNNKKKKVHHLLWKKCVCEFCVWKFRNNSRIQINFLSKSRFNLSLKWKSNLLHMYIES